MEPIDMGQEFGDGRFAQTRCGGLVREWMAAGRVIVVFGSAGLRDRLKRRMMAEISMY
jgi:hypothetical protein